MSDSLPGIFRPEPGRVMSAADWQELDFHVANLFSPHAPVDAEELFSGRTDLLLRMIDVIYQRGLHAVLYGDRGVGKTSLTYILRDRLFSGAKATKIVRRQCTANHTFAMIWQNVFDEFTIDGESADKAIGPDSTAYEIVRLFESFPKEWRPVIIIDEFDRVRDPEATVKMADTIKYLADTSSAATIIVVGVASSVADLFGGHGSIHRNLQQIRMPRMDSVELAKIVSDRAKLANMTIRPGSQEEIVEYSQGLPGYTHLLGQAAFRSAIARRSLEVSSVDLGNAMVKCMNEADESVREAYADAVRSTQSASQYKQALLACAMAETDEKGYFRASAVKEPFQAIVGSGEEYYAQHLKEFCKADRGPALVRVGKPKRFEYRFADALLRPYVIIKGRADGLLPQAVIPSLPSPAPSPT